jgi:hypothetical protein
VAVPDGDACKAHYYNPIFIVRSFEARGQPLKSAWPQIAIFPK